MVASTRSHPVSGTPCGPRGLRRALPGAQVPGRPWPRRGSHRASRHMAVGLVREIRPGSHATRTARRLQAEGRSGRQAHRTCRPPETERARPRSRSPADFACSPRPRSVRCEPEIRTACILAKLAPGSRMPQDAPGAVGEHGCRRREVTLPCAARKGALPHEGSGWPSSSEMVKLVARLKARLRAGS
jgi:hypothetical protein